VEGVGRFRLAAIDVDDTLLGPDGKISAANAAAIAALRARGVRVVLASGRAHANMVRFHEALGLGAGPVISNHGAVVRAASEDDLWFEQMVPAAPAAAATLDGQERGMSVLHYRRDGVYIREKTRWTEKLQARTPAPYIVVPDLLWAGGDGLLKVMWLDDPEVISGLTPESQARYAGELCVTETEPGHLEFTAPTVNKAVALAHVADRLEISREEVLAFGDGNNDAPMLEWAGLGVAMSNARDTAKAAADIVVPDGDPETSLARAIELLLARHFENDASPEHS
jgi:Cof subfamily protein (haloacid dehalogenase superfamily)